MATLKRSAPATTTAFACLRCKLHKVRCIRDTEHDDCVRCSRRGIKCQPAPPSRQGQRPPYSAAHSSAAQESSEVLRQPPHLQQQPPHLQQPPHFIAQERFEVVPCVMALPLGEVAAPMPVPLGEVAAPVPVPAPEAAPPPLSDVALQHFSRISAEWGKSNSCTAFLRGFFRDALPSRDAVTWLLRHWALLATMRECAALMNSTINLASTCGVPISHVVLGLERSMRPAGLPPPEGVVHCVYGLPGFAFARAADPSTDGSIDLIVNPAFEQHVCSLDVLRACWSGNETEMLSLFIHKEDVGILPRETGSFLSRAAVPLVAGVNSPQPVVHPTQRVVRLLVDGSYVACNTMIKACAVEGQIYFGFFLTPIAAPPGQTDASYTLLHLMHTPSNGEATAPHSSCSTSGESSETEPTLRGQDSPLEDAAMETTLRDLSPAELDEVTTSFGVRGW